jgi:hypothetical protein
LAEGTVMDVNRQAWTGTAALLVHPHGCTWASRAGESSSRRATAPGGGHRDRHRGRCGPGRACHLRRPSGLGPGRANGGRRRWGRRGSLTSGSEPQTCRFATKRRRRLPDHGQGCRRPGPGQPERSPALGRRRQAAAAAQRRARGSPAHPRPEGLPGRRHR